MTDAATIRAKLDRLAELDPDAASEVRQLWTHTLGSLDHDDPEFVLVAPAAGAIGAISYLRVLGRLGDLRAQLDRELDELLAAIDNGPAAA